MEIFNMIIDHDHDQNKDYMLFIGYNRDEN